MKSASPLPMLAMTIWMLAVTLSYFAYNGTYYVAKFYEFLPLLQRQLPL